MPKFIRRGSIYLRQDVEMVVEADSIEEAEEIFWSTGSSYDIVYEKTMDCDWEEIEEVSE